VFGQIFVSYVTLSDGYNCKRYPFSQTPFMLLEFVSSWCHHFTTGKK